MKLFNTWYFGDSEHNTPPQWRGENLSVKLELIHDLCMTPPIVKLDGC